MNQQALVDAIWDVLIADSDVSGVVDGRIYQEVAPQAAPQPYIVYNLIVDARDNDLAGAYRINSDLQVSYFDKPQSGPRTAREAIDKVIDVLDGSQLSGISGVDGNVTVTIPDGYNSSFLTLNDEYIQCYSIYNLHGNVEE